MGINCPSSIFRRNKMTVQEKLSTIEQKEQEKKVLYQNLNRSLAIQELWKEAFDNGTVSTFFHGNSYKQIYWTIKRSDGEERTFKLQDLPPVLKDSFKEAKPKRRNK